MLQHFILSILAAVSGSKIVDTNKKADQDFSGDFLALVNLCTCYYKWNLVSVYTCVLMSE